MDTHISSVLRPNTKLRVSCSLAALNYLLPALEAAAKRAETPMALVLQGAESAAAAAAAVRLGCNGVSASAAAAAEIAAVMRDCGTPVIRDLTGPAATDLPGDEFVGLDQAEARNEPLPAVKGLIIIVPTLQRGNAALGALRRGCPAQLPSPARPSALERPGMGYHAGAWEPCELRVSSSLAALNYLLPALEAAAKRAETPMALVLQGAESAAAARRRCVWAATGSRPRPLRRRRSPR